ncbi:SepM family pheromone-processing serine protease [Companilactobacillus nuruki]|uniref:endopeptidase La n=1 Tax=Companilactobacillus nuruki TaxID=1993540 RepID=A0A2N7AW15_9LACO|nr:SepM family pheromone-processing serine protease [Companilactobacillus nuruki]PMD72524.1 peptidase [Companilactobacillus nuruki]
MKFNKTRNKIFGAIFIFIVVVAFFIMPTGYYLEVPGTAEDTSQFVKVDGKHDKKKGNLLLTTVGIVSGTPFTLLKSLGNNFETIYSQQDLMGDENSQEYFRVQQYYMKSATNNAIQAAYSKADKPFTKKYLGVYVMDILDNSDFKKKLEIGDTITSINGYHFNNADQFIKYVKKQDKKSIVKISFLRDGKKKTASGKLVKLANTKRFGLGITLTDNTEAKGNPATKINAGDIGGPSAGLMFTLQVYSQVANKDLKAGRTIAGTGTIDPDGTVGPIGGIEKKVYAASEEGATIFFAPDDPVTKEIKKYEPNYVNNYHLALRAAKKIHTKMKIVPVKNLNDAINYLEKTKQSK